MAGRENIDHIYEALSMAVEQAEVGGLDVKLEEEDDRVLLTFTVRKSKRRFSVRYIRGERCLTWIRRGSTEP